MGSFAYACIWDCIWLTYRNYITILAIDNTIVKSTKCMSSAPTAIDNTIHSYTIHYNTIYSLTKLHNMMCTTLWSGCMSLTLCGCTPTQVQGECPHGWFVFWWEVDTQLSRAGVKTCSSTDVPWRQAVPSWLYHLLCKCMWAWTLLLHSPLRVYQLLVRQRSINCTTAPSTFRTA